MQFAKLLSRPAILVLFHGIAAIFVSGQGLPEKIGVSANRPLPIATGNNLYCAGYIQSGAISTENKIMGAKDEADRFTYAQNDFMLINMGHNKGVNVGDVFSVVRPRGEVKSKWSRKSNLGFYVQEVGAVEVIDVKALHSIARVRASCDNFLLGDLIQLREQRATPNWVQPAALDIFKDSSGKAFGRILMSRDGAEMPSRDFIVYVDLGADDNVHIGDRLTIFRPLEKGNLTDQYQRESVSSRDYGFESDVYKGGKFSNQSARKSGEHANGREVTTKMSKEGRPVGLRKVLGEAVVVNVKEKTATVVITRTAQEIHTGDFVELQ